MFRWYTSYNEFIGALAIFLTATVAVALEHGEEDLGPGKVGLALFSVFQASVLNVSFSSFMLYPHVVSSQSTTELLQHKYQKTKSIFIVRSFF